MDLRGIEFFLTVAEEGSISRAAERLHISQPTVSRDMIELERELGKTLLVRTSRNVSLTPDGLLFRDTARDMLALYRKAVTQQAEPVELAGDIYLGAGETESFSFMAEQIKAFREEHPKVCFHVISENADEIRDDVDKGVLDFGFVMRSGNLDRYARMEIQRRESWGVLVPAEHPLARKKSNLIHNVLLLVKNGAGLILCLNDPALVESGLVFVPLRPAHWVSPVLIWKKQAVHAPAARAFLDSLGYSEDE